MVKEIVDEILQAEAQADEIVATATKQAKEIREQGEAQRALIAEEAKKAAADLLSALEAETEQAAREAEELVLRQGREKAAAVRQDAEGRVTEAAKAVSDRVLQKYGVTAL